MAVPNPSLLFNETALARFWAKVDQSGDCWEWTGEIDPDGYGRFKVAGHRSSRPHASRAAYALLVGPIPDGMLVCHTCDNRRCVRPEHLFLGTAKDNTHDMLAKGRECRGPEHHAYGVGPPRQPTAEERPRGERCNSKLTAVLVLDIRAMASEGVPRRVIAEHAGVSVRQVYRVVAREVWAHIA